jgi:hypothetical protein
MRESITYEEIMNSPIYRYNLYINDKFIKTCHNDEQAMSIFTNKFKLNQDVKIRIDKIKIADNLTEYTNNRSKIEAKIKAKYQ